MSKIVFVSFHAIEGLLNNQGFKMDKVGVATVFNKETSMLSVGLAFKSILDDFDRKKGSILAVSRASEMPFFNSKLDVSKFNDDAKLLKKFLKKWHQGTCAAVVEHAG